MIKATHRFTLLCALAAGIVFFLAVQGGTAYAKESPKSAFITEMLGQLDRVRGQIMSLENAIPQEKMSWRPGEGVRSVSEVYLHIAGSNYGFLSITGSKPPAGSRVDEKSTTDKAKIADVLKTSFDWTKDELSKIGDADLEKEVNMFGQKTTVRNVLITFLGHMHEHFGQSIAYARTNDVVPPWTAARQAQMKNQPTKK